MSGDVAVSPETPRASTASALASAAAVTFMGLLALLHVIEPEFDPSRRLISEYELGQYGWVMSLAFFALAAAVAGVVASTSRAQPPRRRLTCGRAWFSLVAAALVGAGVFYPDPSPDSTAALLHGVCGITVILSFPFAATLVASGLARTNEWAESRHRLLVATPLVWVGLLTFFGSIVYFHPTTAADKADMVIGWQNRFMILSYALWVMAVTARRGGASSTLASASAPPDAVS